MSVTVGSLFAGIGGLELGLERAGMKTIWQVEKDQYARRVLEKRWPTVQRFEDVRDCGAHNLAWVDLICGGFPCQGVSNAGKRQGLKDERSGLWSEFARIIRELRPRFVLVENVAALRSRGLDRVLGDLAACGFDSEWDCIPAAAVGAPHRRDRIFVVAYRAGGRQQEQRERDCNSDGGQQASFGNGAGRCGTDVADADCSRFSILSGGSTAAELARFRATRSGGWWQLEPQLGGVVDGLPGRMDGPGRLEAWERGVPRAIVLPTVRAAQSKRVARLKCLGSAVVPQVAEFIGRRLLEALKECSREAMGNGWTGRGLQEALRGGSQ